MGSAFFDTLPATAESVGTWPWSRIAPYYEDLLARPLNAETVSDWLLDWTRIGALIDEAGVRFTIATTSNTADTQAEREYTAFLQQVMPEALAMEQRVKQMLLESGLEPSGFEVALRKLRTDAALFRPDNGTLLAEERRLSLEYDKISGAQTIFWEGKDVPLVQVYPVLQETERNRRESAWRAIQSRYLEDLPLGRSLAESPHYPPVHCPKCRLLQLSCIPLAAALSLRLRPGGCQSLRRRHRRGSRPRRQSCPAARRDRLEVATLPPWDWGVTRTVSHRFAPIRRWMSSRTALRVSLLRSRPASQSTLPPCAASICWTWRAVSRRPMPATNSNSPPRASRSFLPSLWARKEM